LGRADVLTKSAGFEVRRTADGASREAGACLLGSVRATAGSHISSGTSTQRPYAALAERTREGPLIPVPR